MGRSLVILTTVLLGKWWRQKKKKSLTASEETGKREPRDIKFGQLCKILF